MGKILNLIKCIATNNHKWANVVNIAKGKQKIHLRCVKCGLIKPKRKQYFGTKR